MINISPEEAEDMGWIDRFEMEKQNEERWREIRKTHQSQMSFHISEAMVGAYHRWGGFEAAKTGMVNVEGKMVEAVIGVLTNNDWLNDAGVEALGRREAPSSQAQPTPSKQEKM